MRALTAVASAKAGVRVQQPLQICLGWMSTCLPAGRKAKSVTTCPTFSIKSGKQLTFIVRVMRSCFILNPEVGHPDQSLVPF